MDTGALRSYVDRTRELVDSSPELSERNTQIRLVQPFLTALGWELHQIAADREVPTAEGSVAVDFALLVDDEPAVLVETSACGTDLGREQAERLGRALLSTGVDRGVLTNGREFAFVAADGDGLDRFECRLEALPDRADAVGHYAREAVERDVRNGRRRRHEAADALADERETVVEDVRDRLVATAGDAVAERLRTESERFVDDLIASLRDDGDVPDAEADAAAVADAEAASSTESTTAVDADPTTATDADSASASGSGAESPLDAESERTLEALSESASDVPAELDSDGDETAATDAASESADAGEADTEPSAERAPAAQADVPADALGAAVADDGQYVVRLFGGRTSVWAVGHARAAMTTAQAIEYLLGRGAAEGRGLPAGEPVESLSPPWGPDSEHAVLRADPVENATIELSNGWHLDARVPVDAATAAIERLAERAGLRAMFQEEWARE